MPVNTPKLSEIRDSIVNDLKASLGISSAVFGKNFLYVFAGVLAAKLKLFYLSSAEVQKNLAPDLASTEANGGTLERFGRLKLGRNPYPATSGVYSLDVTGEIGAVIKSGTTWKSDDDSSNPGYLFVIDADFTMTAVTETITVRALTTGSSSEMVVNDTASSTSPILNVDSTATFSAVITSPVDAETIDQYREKVVLSERLEPQGGAASDFRLWSYDAVGVKQSYPYAKSGASAEVVIYIEVDTTVDTQGVAPNSVLEEVAEVIEFDPDTTKPLYERGRRPLGVFDVEVLSIVPLDVEISINGLTDLSQEIQDLISESLESYIKTVRPFVSGADIIANENDVLSINKIAYVVVSSIPDNVRFDSISLTVNSSSASNFQFTKGFIPYLENISFN